MVSGLELFPIGVLGHALCEQLAKTALAARDISSDRSFKQLGDYLLSIQMYVYNIINRAEDTPSLMSALSALNLQVSKAEKLVTEYKSRSLLSNILHCRSISESLQKAMRDIGKTLQLLELGAIGLNDVTRNALNQLEHEMTQAVVRVSSEHEQILEMLKDANDRDFADRALLNDVLSRIACALGLVHEPETFSGELSKFKKDIDEAKERKEQQELKYMEQLLSLLSREDAAAALANSERNYLDLKKRVVSSGESFIIDRPPSHIICHLTGEVMENPVILSSGRSYERKAIEARFAEGTFTDPVSAEPLNNHTLRSNSVLETALKEWKHKNVVARILKAKAMLIDNSEDDKEAALTDLSSLCRENTACKDWIVFEGVIPYILGAATSKRSTRLRFLCFSVLQELVQDRDHAKETLFNSGGLKQIIKNLRKGRSLVRAALLLLLELVKNEDILVHFAQEQGSILLLVTVLLSGDYELLREEIEHVLNRLAVHKEFVKEMVKANWFKPLILQLQNESEEYRVDMAVLLSDLELDDSRREALIEAHVIEPLVSILKSEYLEQKLVSLKALHNVLCNEKAKTQFAELGAVPLVIESLQKFRHLKGSALDVLVDLTVHNGYVLLISENGNSINMEELVTLLVDILGSRSTALRTNSLKVLCNIAMPPAAYDVCKIISDPKSRLEVFATLIKIEQPPVRDAAIQLLTILSVKDAELISSLRNDHEFLKRLLDLLKVDDFNGMSLQMAAVGILSRIPVSANCFQELKITEDVFLALLNMLFLNDLKAQENAVRFLTRFTDTASIDFLRCLIQVDIIDHLKHPIRFGTTTSKIMSCNILRNISRITPILCMEPQRRSFKFSRKSSINCKIHRAKCNLKETFCILDAGIIPDVVDVLRDQDADLALAAMEVLETVLVGDNFQNGVEILYKLDAMERLFPFFQVVSHPCSEKCICLFEIILKVPDMRARYGQKIQRVLNTLIASSTPSLKQKAIQVYKQLS
eukprot:TRINITY_DN8149_c0_g1_i1.p1 TRINITY_DN8149_c0_g1~~TRINITY_DN8149_c0_g1_i1.p1  ORF type:complete len:991 (-),score=194.30 TRINITY_DN8149_c0_g1_i1:526-3498(-)